MGVPENTKNRSTLGTCYTTLEYIHLKGAQSRYTEMLTCSWLSLLSSQQLKNEMRLDLHQYMKDKENIVHAQWNFFQS